MELDKRILLFSFFFLLPTLSPRGIKRWEEYGKLYGKSSEKDISSRRIKLIRPAVVSRAYFKCHWCSLPPNSALETSAAAETSRRRLSMARRPVLYALRDEQRAREPERQTEIAPHRIWGGRESGGCDVRRNPGAQSWRCRCRGNLSTRAYACQPFDAKQKLYMTPVRLEKGRNTRGTGRVPGKLSPRTFSYTSYHKEWRRWGSQLFGSRWSQHSYISLFYSLTYRCRS